MSPRTANRRSAAIASGKASAGPAGLRRVTRGGAKALRTGAAKESSSSLESQSDNGDGEDASEDDLEDEDAEEPEEYAPSRLTRQRRRGHQTGLSISLSKTGIGNLGSRKRSMSNSSEGTVTARPIKRSKSNVLDEQACDSSDDEAYDGVNDISESEEDASDIEELETQNIRSEVENGWTNFDDDTGMLNTAFDEQYARTDLNNSREPWAVPLVESTESTHTEGTPARRVRFVGIDSSSSSSSATSEYDNTFPDLLSYDLGYPSNQKVEMPDDEDDDDQSSEGYWDIDFRTPDAVQNRIMAEYGFGAPDSSSSGYETDSDDGTTTEEEPEPLQHVSQPKKLLELRSDSPKPDGFRPKRLGMPRTRPATVPSRKGPILGTWIADPSKPIAIIDRTGGLKYYHVPSKTYGTLESNTSSVDSSPQRAFVPLAQPNFSGGISQADESHLNTPTGLIGAMSSEPFLPMEFEGAAVFPDFDDEEDDSDDKISITDFIDFGDNTSDNEKASESESQTPAKTFPTAKLPKITPKQSADRTSSQRWLEHFNRRGDISAFRRNQHHVQTQINRMPTSGLMAIKGGRHAIANNPISPLRKRKASRSLSQSSGPASGVSHKRRLTGPITRHRQNTL